MRKIRAAVVGYGNIGHYAVEALEAAKDFEIVGIVRRQGDKDKPLELTPYEVVDDIKKLKDVDVAILAAPTRSCPEYAEKIVALGINTVDSYDIHTGILDYRTKQTENCKKRRQGEHHCCGLGSGFRLSCARSVGKPCAKGSLLHQLRSGNVDGTLCLRTQQERGKERTVSNHPTGREYPSPYGLCRTGGWCDN